LARCEPERIEDDQRFAGRILFPWNDRIPGGSYSFAGERHSLRINCAEDGSAIHGFLYRRTMELVGDYADADSARLVLRARLLPGEEPGYPFAPSLRVEYRLEEGRFSLGFTMRNDGQAPAPVALGWHPYFRLEGPSENWLFEHKGESFVPVGPDLMPLGAPEPVAGSPWDFRRARPLGKGPIDIALAASADGLCRLRGPGGLELRIEADPRLFRYTQLYLPPERDALAIESVSAATDAFNRDGLGLIVLAKGEERSGSVSLRLGRA
ncbi:MAG TPA: aldose 1-epimerase, partial [Rectinemataceae bacterium]|nr:aldose 1-epimerase [Rectinemataceae bacterium]